MEINRKSTMIFIVHVLNLCNYFMAKEDEKIQSGMMKKYIVKMMKHTVQVLKKKKTVLLFDVTATESRIQSALWWPMGTTVSTAQNSGTILTLTKT